MTREEFVRAYAARSNLSDKWATLGFIEAGDHLTYIALPCGCGADDCEGWAMVSDDGALIHLELYAPWPLRKAYREAIYPAAQQEKE